MTVMPGASWRPITVPGGLSARAKGRAVILHVAASEATSLFGFFNNNTSANSHFYVNKAGVIEQYIDTDYQSWTSLAANRNTIGVETQGGVTNPDGEPWTPQQVASLASICAWAHADEGVPLTLMPNSLPTSRGIGYHRLGIKPWVIAGGEVWSSSTGKLCPGAAKIAQVPQIIAAATNPAGDDMTPDQWNFIQQAMSVTNTALGNLLNAVGDPKVGLQKLTGDLHGKVVDSVFGLEGRPGPDADDLLGQVLSLRAEVRALQSQAPASPPTPAGGATGITAQDKADIVAAVLNGMSAMHLAK